MASELPKDIPDEVQRWTAKRRLALVLSILKGETTVVEAARKHGLTVADVEEWRDRFLADAENSLRSHSRIDEALKDEMIKKLQRSVWKCGYRMGMSGQGAPVRRNHRIAFKMGLGGVGGRPLPSARRRLVGISGSIRAHCAFVRPMPTMSAPANPLLLSFEKASSLQHPRRI